MLETMAKKHKITIYYFDIDVYPTSMMRWGWWDGVKCVAGTLGSVGTDFLPGTAVGTITIPGVGTLSGMLAGSVSGGLVGIASFC